MADREAFPDLVEAVRKGDETAVARLLDTRPELAKRLNDPMPDSFGSPLLFGAVDARSLETVDVLLARGADINTRSDWWAGPFHVLETCDPAIAEPLIARGATLGAHASARLGYVDRLTSLLDRNPAAVHQRAGDGKTPLHYASTVDIAKLLLDRGADIDAIDVDHESTPAQYLVRDHPDVARFLVTRRCRTDILLAAALGATELVRRHLDADARAIRTRVTPEWFPMKDSRAGGTIYNWTLGGGKTAHVVAHEGGHREVFDLLMERSPRELQLMVACVLHDAALAESLAATSPAAEDLEQLGRSASFNDSAAVKLMLRAGWPVDARFEGVTALHWAGFHGNSAMVDLLLAAGAPRDVRDPNYDGTPLDWSQHGRAKSWHRASGDYAGVIRALSTG